MSIPKFYKFIIKYITPLFLFFILGFWFIQQAVPVILLKGVKPENIPFVLGTRLGLVALFLFTALLVRIAWKMKARLRQDFGEQAKVVK